MIRCPVTRTLKPGPSSPNSLYFPPLPRSQNEEICRRRPNPRRTGPVWFRRGKTLLEPETATTHLPFLLWALWADLLKFWRRESSSPCTSGARRRRIFSVRASSAPRGRTRKREGTPSPPVASSSHAERFPGLLEPRRSPDHRRHRNPSSSAAATAISGEERAIQWAPSPFSLWSVRSYLDGRD